MHPSTHCQQQQKQHNCDMQFSTMFPSATEHEPVVFGLYERSAVPHHGHHGHSTSHKMRSNSDLYRPQAAGIRKQISRSMEGSAAGSKESLRWPFRASQFASNDFKRTTLQIMAEKLSNGMLAAVPSSRSPQAGNSGVQEPTAPRRKFIWHTTLVEDPRKTPGGVPTVITTTSMTTATASLITNPKTAVPSRQQLTPPKTSHTLNGQRITDWKFSKPQIGNPDFNKVSQKSEAESALITADPSVQLTCGVVTQVRHQHRLPPCVLPSFDELLLSIEVRDILPLR